MALAAAVRIAVTSPASTTTTGAPVDGSKSTITPWCDGPPAAKFPGNTLISLAPNGRSPPSAPGMTPNMFSPPKGRMARRSWLVSPLDTAVMASRINGMHTS